MITSRFAALAGGIALASAFVLSGCAAGGSTGGSTPGANGGGIGPITISAEDLQGSTQTLSLSGQKTINITTGDIAPEDYQLVSATPEGIVEFSPGSTGTGGAASFNPGVTAVAVGEAEVVIGAGSGIQDVTFTVVVTE